MTKSNISIKKLKRQILSHVKIVRAVILVIVLFITLILGFFIYRGVARSIVGEGVGLVRDFVIPSTDRIKTSNGRINVLILGIGGAGHDAPNLTDTMILASVSVTNHKMSLISVPRDIWIPDLKDKINSGYMRGGLVLAKSTVEEVLGIQIDYAIVLDFSGFKDIVDTLGGIEVNVKNSFTDNLYPIAGKENDNCNGDLTFACRYMTVSFSSGSQTMNGDTALQFVRSRHATGTEGSDIARSARQQLVIAAIMKKIITPQIITNPGTDIKLFKIFQNNFTTDLKSNEEATLARFIFNAKSDMKSFGIPDNLLYNPPNQYKYHNEIFTHAFVFIPNNNQSINGSIEDWSDVQKWVTSILP